MHCWLLMVSMWDWSWCCEWIRTLSDMLWDTLRGGDILFCYIYSRFQTLPIWGLWSSPTRPGVTKVVSEVISQKTSRTQRRKKKYGPLFDRWPKLRSFRLILDLCPQRQVRHPFVHDLQDCWQTQRHLYISESARDQWPNPTQIHYPKPLHSTFSHLSTGSLVQNLPTIPNPTPRTWWPKDKEIPWSLFYSGCFALRVKLQPSIPVYHCLCILYLLCPLFPLLQSSCPFFPQISHWLRTCDPVCLFPRPLWKESVLARGPDVEHCCSPTGAHMPHSEETPLLVYTVNHHWIIKP